MENNLGILQSCLVVLFMFGLTSVKHVALASIQGKIHEKSKVLRPIDESASGFDIVNKCRGSNILIYVTV